MTSLNQKTIIGNVGKDPEFRVNKNGLSIATFSVATDESWQTKSGEKKKNTDWHKCTCSGKKAELVRDILKKGDRVFVQGPTKTKQYEADAIKYTVDVLLIETFMLLDKKTEQEKNHEMHT